MARRTGVEQIVTNAPVNYYLDRARDRALYKATTPLFGKLKDAYTSNSAKDIITVAKQIAALDNQFLVGGQAQTFAEAIDAVMVDFLEARSAQLMHSLRGVETGYMFLNRATGGGWQGSDNVALAGRIGDGKTYIMLKHAFSAWEAGRSVLFQSNEMGTIQLARRMIGIKSGINTRNILRGRVGTWGERKIREAVVALKDNVPFHCIAGNFTASTAMLRALFEEYSPDIGFCDASYLLKPEVKHSSRRENLVDVAEDLKKISIETGRPLIHSVQLNRQAVQSTKKVNRTTTRAEEAAAADQQQANQEANDPLSHLGLHMIAETDAVAANASVVMFLSKVPGHDARRYYGVGKGREGERGVWTINYEFDSMNFEEVTQEQAEAERYAEFNHML